MTKYQKDILLKNNLNIVNKSIIISYKKDNEEREKNLKRLLYWLSYAQDTLTEIILVEQGQESTIDWLNEINGKEYIKHIFIKNDGIFNLGWGYNVGVKAASTDLLIFNSVDVIVKHLFIKNAHQIIHGCDFVKGYSNLIELDKKDTEDYIQINYRLSPNVKHVLVTDNTLTNGVFMMKKDIYFMVKGFDEDCYGYGYQDYIFDQKLKILEFKTKVLNDTAIEMYHRKEKHGMYYYFTKANEELYKEYKDFDKDDLIEKLNEITVWGDSDITKSNEVSIRHVKRELFEKATEEIIKHFTEKLTKEYIDEIVISVTNTMYNSIAESIKDKIHTDLKDFKINNKKKTSLIRKILEKFKL